MKRTETLLSYLNVALLASAFTAIIVGNSIASFMNLAINGAFHEVNRGELVRLTGIFGAIAKPLSFFICILAVLHFRHLWLDPVSTFSGRMSRRDYWIQWFLPGMAIGAAMGMVFVLQALIAYLLSPDSFYVIEDSFVPAFITGYWQISIAMLMPGLAVGIRRLHDRGKSGWFMLIALIPVVGSLWLFVEFGFLPGKAGDNEYGPDPLAARGT